MEQVSTPIVRKVLDDLRKPGSPYRNKFDYIVVDMSKYGVPQFRKRLLAGSKKLIARFRRLRQTRRSVRDVILQPRGTHVRNETRNGSVRSQIDRDGERRVMSKRYTNDECCTSIDGPGLTITASNTLRWASPGTGKPMVRMTKHETALMQTFPHDYKIALKRGPAIRGIGNALPPIIMQQLLTGKAPEFAAVDKAVSPEPESPPSSPSLSL